MSERSGDWATRGVMTVLGGLVDEAWAVMGPNLAGLTDDEYLWEPAPGSWSVRRREDVRAPDCWGSGAWVVETCLDGLTVPPSTTIAWRLMHAYDCTNDFTRRAFGQGGQGWNSIEVPGSAADAVALMTAAMHRLRGHLDTATDDVLLGPIDTDFNKPRWLLLDKALLESIHHTAEIGVLRNLIRLRR